MYPSALFPTSTSTLPRTRPHATTVSLARARPVPQLQFRFHQTGFLMVVSDVRSGAVVFRRSFPRRSLPTFVFGAGVSGVRFRGGRLRVRFWGVRFRRWFPGATQEFESKTYLGPFGAQNWIWPGIMRS